jgi:hypothetical protein
MSADAGSTDDGLEPLSPSEQLALLAALIEQLGGHGRQRRSSARRCARASSSRGPLFTFVDRYGSTSVRRPLGGTWP